MTTTPRETPPGVHMEERGEGEKRELVLVVSWFQGFAVFALLCSLVMALPAAIFWISGEEPAIALFLSLLPLGALYWSLAMLFNRTTITWSDRWLSVKHGPLPWPQAFDTGTQRIARFALHAIHRHRRGRRVGTQHDAVAIVDGVALRLLPGVSDATRHRFVVETLTALLTKGGPSA